MHAGTAPLSMHSMISVLVPVSALLMGAALLLGGVGILNTVLALRGSAEGFSDSVIGLVLSAYFAGFLVGTWLGPRIISRVGHIRAFALFSAVASSATLLHVLLIDPWAWALLRVLTGVAMVGLYAVIESWMSVVAPRDQRGTVFASYMMVNFSALAASQGALIWLPTQGFAIFALAAILITLALTPVVLTGLAQPALGPDTRFGASRLLKIAPLAAVGALLSGVATSAVWGMVPLMLGKLGQAPADIAPLMIVIIMSGALAQIPMGHLGDRVDRRWLLLGLSVTATVAGGLIFLAIGANANVVWLVPGLALLGASGFCVYPACVALCNDHLRPQEIVAAASSLLLFHGGGAVLGPIVAGAMMQWSGPGGLGLYFALAWGLLAIYAAWRSVVARRPKRQRSGFAWMLRTTPVVLELLEEDIDA